MAQKKRFHRHLETRESRLYWILFAYLVVGWFYPVVGLVALVCMIGPVLTSVWRGRWWCGHACPRGNMYSRLLSRYSPHRPVPRVVRTFGFRLFMVFFIFTVFGVQMYFAWGDWGEMGRVFWNIILLTTVVGVALSFIYAPRTWCSFCPMGTLSSWVTPRGGKLPTVYTSVHVGDSCQMKCKSCARVCPMQLAPYDSRGAAVGHLHPDCIKCGYCVQACPSKIMEIRPAAGNPSAPST